MLRSFIHRKKLDTPTSPDYVPSIPVTSNLEIHDQSSACAHLNEHNYDSSSNMNRKGILKETQLPWQETSVHFLKITLTPARILNLDLAKRN